MKKGYLLLPIVVITIALGITGCKTGDIWSSLDDASSYIAIVGHNMQAKGYDFFPDNVLSWACFVDDLKGSIKEAKSISVSPTGAVRDIETKILALPEPDMQSLGKAFKSNPEW